MESGAIEEKKAMESRGVPFYFAPLPTIWTPGTGYLCTDTVISLHRGRFYARCAKNSSLYREYRYIEDRYIGVLSHTFYCNFCRVIAYLSLYRGYRYIEDRCIGVPLYYLVLRWNSQKEKELVTILPFHWHWCLYWLQFHTLITCNLLHELIVSQILIC